MKIALIRLNNYVWLFFPLLLIVFSLSIFNFLDISNISDPELRNIYTAVTIDCCVIAPIFYFLLVRKTNIPDISTVFVFLVSVILATVFLPEKNQHLLSAIKSYFLPVLEVSVFLFFVWNIKKIYLLTSKCEFYSLDKFYSFVLSLKKVIPVTLSSYICMELGFLYYTFIKWGKAKPSAENSSPFTFFSSTNNSVITVLIAIILLIPVEAFAMHLLVSYWSNVFAWILTSISIYSILQTVGMLKSIILRQIFFQNSKLVLRFGILNFATLDINNISKIYRSSEKTDFSLIPGVFRDFSQTNVVIECHDSGILYSTFGKDQQFDKFSFYVNKPELLIEYVTDKKS